MNYEFFEQLNRLVPGSVEIDRKNSTVRLTGWRLKEFNNSHQEQDGTNQVEEKTGSLNASPLEGEDSFPKHIFLVDGCGRRVINPLTDTDSNTSKGNQSCCTCRVSRKHPSARKKKDKASEGDKDFVPGVKSKLRQWVLHFFNHLIQKISRDFKQISKGGKRG